MRQNTLNTFVRLMNLDGSANLIPMPISGACVDSRLMMPGNIFFALKGEHVDGHTYLSEAASRGAVAAVVHTSYQGSDYGMPLIRTGDVLGALQILATNLLASSRSRIVAVTGSLGKTTTKDFLTTILKSKFLTASSPGNSNSQIGLPLALINHTTGQEDMLVLEMGMTHPGQLAKLTSIAPPDIALITSTALVHACNFDSLEDIGRAKGEIFLHPRTRLGILSRDIMNFQELVNMGRCTKESFSIQNSSADYYGTQENGQVIIATKDAKINLPSLMLPGNHNRHNFLAAALAAHHLGISWEEIGEAVHALKLPERRLQRIERNGILFINDSYNASVPSLKAALSEMPEPKKGGRKIAVIGEILELGKFSEPCHQEIAEHSLQCVDEIFCLGKGCRPILSAWKSAEKPATLYDDLYLLVKALVPTIKAGDVVLLKGSRGKSLWKILEDKAFTPYAGKLLDGS